MWPLGLIHHLLLLQLLLLQVVLGALFHDVGHLAGQREGQEKPRMVIQGITLGVAHHEVVGECIQVTLR